MLSTELAAADTSSHHLHRGEDTASAIVPASDRSVLNTSISIQEDAWRFPEETSKKLTRTIGAYASDLTPSTTVRSVTGVPRGTELFARPELYRPWRSSSAQRSAASTVEREHEIEVVTKKSSELRAEVAGLQRELQRTQQKLRAEKSAAEEQRMKETDKLKAELRDAKAELVKEKHSTEQQLKALRNEHETEMKTMQHKIKASHDASNEMGNAFMLQITGVKNAAAREVALVQQLGHAKTAELSNELDAARDAIRRLQERTSTALAEMQQEMHRSEERCVYQMREQENRYEQMRDAMQKDQHQVEQQRDQLMNELTNLRENNKSLSFDVRSADSRFKDWNVRVLGDLDHLCDYFSTIVGELERQADHQQQTMNNGSSPRNSTNDPYAKDGQDGEHKQGSVENLMDQVANRIHLLGRLKQRHAVANQLVLKRVQGLEGAVNQSQETYQRNVHERDLQLTRLHAEVGESKARQERLEKALEDSRVQTRAAEDLIQSTMCRLTFLNEDLGKALVSCRVNPPRAQQVTFVTCMVQGSSILWEKVPSAMQLALSMGNDVLRQKMNQHGGYEFATDADSMMIAFHDPVSACKFCLEAQQWLLALSWPGDLNMHHDTQEVVEPGQDGMSRVVFRGLRYGMALHFGDTTIEATSVPLARGEPRIKYFGRTISQMLHIASICNGGQIIATSAVWHMVKEKLHEMANPIVSDMGQHRVTTTSADAAVPSSELLGLCQIMPRELSGRRFSNDSASDSAVVHRGQGVSHQLSNIWRNVTGHQVTALREHFSQLTQAGDVLADEMQSITSTLTSLACRVQEAQTQGRIYSQADIIAHISALDRLSARADVIKRDVGRLGDCQKDLGKQMKSVEDLVLQHTKQLMSEDEFKKRLQLVNDRCNERLFESTLQTEQKVQQLRNQLSKLESTNTELRRQGMMKQHPQGGGSATATGGPNSQGFVLAPDPTAPYQPSPSSSAAQQNQHHHHSHQQLTTQPPPNYNNYQVHDPYQVQALPSSLPHHGSGGGKAVTPHSTSAGGGKTVAGNAHARPRSATGKSTSSATSSTVRHKLTSSIAQGKR